MIKETEIQQGADAGPTDIRPRRSMPDDLPDGSGNDGPKHPEMPDEDRFDAG